MKVTDYKILIFDSSLDLVKETKKALREDWELYGPPFTGSNMFCQALIKQSKEDQAGE